MDKTFQTIQGFGIDSALMPSDKSLPMNDLFGLEGPNALGLSILRVGMNSDGTLTGQGISKGAKIIGSTWSPPPNCKTNGNTQKGGHLINGVAVAGWIHCAHHRRGVSMAVLVVRSLLPERQRRLGSGPRQPTIAKRYFALGNYSRFVRPGFVAVSVAGNEDANVLLSAYKSEEGGLVIVAINKATPRQSCQSPSPAARLPHH